MRWVPFSPTTMLRLAAGLRPRQSLLPTPSCLAALVLEGCEMKLRTSESGQGWQLPGFTNLYVASGCARSIEPAHDAATMKMPPLYKFDDTGQPCHPSLSLRPFQGEATFQVLACHGLLEDVQLQHHTTALTVKAPCRLDSSRQSSSNALLDSCPVEAYTHTHTHITSIDISAPHQVWARATYAHPPILLTKT